MNVLSLHNIQLQNNKVKINFQNSSAEIHLSLQSSLMEYLLDFFPFCHINSSNKFWRVSYLMEQVKVLVGGHPTYTEQLLVTLETIELQVARLSIQDQSFGSRINH